MKFFRKIKNLYPNFLIYNDKYYRWINENAGPSARNIVDILIQHSHPSSVIDAGCGTGIYLREFHKRGVKIKGIE